MSHDVADRFTRQDVKHGQSPRVFPDLNLSGQKQVEVAHALLQRSARVADSGRSVPADTPGGERVLLNDLARFQIPDEHPPFFKHKSGQVLSILVEGKAVGHRPQAAQRDVFRVAQVLEIVPLPAAQIAARAVQQIFALHDIGALPLPRGEGNRAGVGDALGHLPSFRKIPLRELRFLASARFRFGEALGGLGVFAGRCSLRSADLLRLAGSELAPLGRFGQPGLSHGNHRSSHRDKRYERRQLPRSARQSPACAGTIARPLPRARSDARESAPHSEIGSAPERIPGPWKNAGSGLSPGT